MKTLWAPLAALCLGAAGPVIAGSCATANVPGATLLAPYFRVSRNGVTSANTEIPDLPGQADTLMAITNASNTGVIVHATVWSKYGVPVLSFNVPMTAFDVATFRMKDVLNGKLNVNPNAQLGSPASDPCGLNQLNGIYAPVTGFGATRFTRFRNPDAGDAGVSVSRYQTPAFNGSFRQLVWDSLDESGDVTSVTSPGAFVVDEDTSCPGVTPDGVLSGDFSGSMTFDVVNYCTSLVPTRAEYYANDAIATAGWTASGYTPNAIMGDIFLIDGGESGNVSGDPMVSVEFDETLSSWSSHKTFYGRYGTATASVPNEAVPAAFRFVGDGREALGTRYGFRYLSAAPQGLRSWATVWRSDRYGDSANDLCGWRASRGTKGSGFYDDPHALVVSMYDQDENTFVTNSGSWGGPPRPLYFYLESQRLDILSNADLNPGAFKFGWIDVAFPGGKYNQAWVGVQHSGPGELLSVGHGAALLDRVQCARGVFPTAREAAALAGP